MTKRDKIEKRFEKTEEIRSILNDGSEMIDKPESQEYFQRKYGLDLYSTEDNRTFEKAK